MNFQVAPEAEADLDEIWLYLAQESGNPIIATRVVNSITDRFVLLAKFPNMGRSRDPDLLGRRRSFPIDRYVIFYRVQSGQVQILRVLHGSRDVQAIFADE
jgi:toxin ParE1/3/4